MKYLMALALLAGVALPGAGQAAISCTLLVDAATGKALVREGQCEQRVTPASTFKVAISLMGYDSGILVDTATPQLPFREGYVDWLPEWRTTTSPAAWMKHSVVWYSQQITTRLGAERFQSYIDRFDYGIDAWPSVIGREVEIRIELEASRGIGAPGTALPDEETSR